MHTIQGRYIVFFQQSRGGYVCQNHALLDELVRIVPDNRNKLTYLLIVVEDNARFGGIKFDSTTLGARCRKRAIERMKLLNHRHKRLMLLAQR